LQQLTDVGFSIYDHVTAVCHFIAIFIAIITIISTPGSKDPGG